MSDPREIVIPFSPRAQQREILDNLKRFSVLVCHRRFGKTVLCVNQLIRAALSSRQHNPRFAYICPLFKQAKQVAWDYLKHYTDPIPGRTAHENELRVDFPNGARVQLFGTDNPDALRGLYLDGAVLDEYAQMPPRVWTEVLRPALSDRKGWAIFIGTPMGHNAFWDLWQYAQEDDDWFSAMWRASETGIIDPDELLAAKREMGEDEFAQEYECSFTAAVRGAYYGKLMAQADDDGRIANVPFDPAANVDTWWDLGVSDSTSIWFVQHVGQEIHVIDYYEASGEGLNHYAGILQQKQGERGMVYGRHLLPHDAAARELGTGKSRVEVLDALGVKATVMERHNVMDGIQTVRNLLPRCWFDRKRCAEGIEALRLYRREWDDRKQTFRAGPLHDWTSHAADAFRCGAMAPAKSATFRPLEYPKNHVSHGVI